LLSHLTLTAVRNDGVATRWFFRNLVFSDGTQASFEGRGGQVWFYFVIAAVLGFLPQLSQVFHEDQQLVVRACCDG